MTASKLGGPGPLASRTGSSTTGDPNPLADKIAAAIVKTDEVEAIEPPEPLIEQFIYADSIAMLYGPSGTGKTLLATDLALHVATGSWWQGRPVKSGTVLYVLAEGAASFGPRVKAWKQHHGLNDLAEIDW
jgi:hypothetical protein